MPSNTNIMAALSASNDRGTVLVVLAVSQGRNFGVFDAHAVQCLSVAICGLIVRAELRMSSTRNDVNHAAHCCNDIQKTRENRADVTQYDRLCARVGGDRHRHADLGNSRGQPSISRCAIQDCRRICDRKSRRFASKASAVLGRGKVECALSSFSERRTRDNEMQIDADLVELIGRRLSEVESRLPSDCPTPGR